MSAHESGGHHEETPKAQDDHAKDHNKADDHAAKAEHAQKETKEHAEAAAGHEKKADHASGHAKEHAEAAGHEKHAAEKAGEHAKEHAEAAHSATAEKHETPEGKPSIISRLRNYFHTKVEKVGKWFNPPPDKTPLWKLPIAIIADGVRATVNNAIIGLKMTGEDIARTAKSTWAAVNKIFHPIKTTKKLAVHPLRTVGTEGRPVVTAADTVMGVPQTLTGTVERAYIAGVETPVARVSHTLDGTPLIHHLTEWTGKQVRRIMGAVRKIPVGIHRGITTIRTSTTRELDQRLAAAAI